MYFSPKVILSVLFFSLFLKTGYIFSQEEIKESQWNSRLLDAQEFMNSFQNNDAIKILESLEEEIANSDSLNTKIGFKVQDKFAEALEKEHKDELAIEKLIKISEQSKDLEFWEVYANSQLSLARLQEKIGRKERCLKHLRLAEKLIEEHSIRHLFPRFEIRISSYHRLFADRDSSVYYANRALISATEMGQDPEIGVAHLLLGLLNPNDSYEETMEHFEIAGAIWGSVGDHVGHSFAYNNLARLHYRNGKKNLAMVYNDSTIVAGKRGIKLGQTYEEILSTAYHFRSQLFKESGQLDSALFYSNLAFQMELDEANRSNSEKIIEIDSRYNNKIKSQTIIDQQKLINVENKRKKLVTALFLTFLIFSLLLGMAYLRLKIAIRRIKNQRSTIRETNSQLTKSLEHSKVLQAELHHRVKNNLQIIIGLCELQMKDIDDSASKNKLESMANRIHAMAATHDAFNLDAKDEVDVGDFLESITNNFRLISNVQHPLKIEQEVERMELSLETLMPLGMILHELLTNSIKYFSNHKETLIIKINLVKQNDYILLEYRDNGPGFESGFMKSREGGLGNSLLNSMVRQLNGRWETSNDNGALVKIYLKEKTRNES